MLVQTTFVIDILVSTFQGLLKYTIIFAGYKICHLKDILIIVFTLGCGRILAGEDLGGRRPCHAGGGLINFLQKHISNSNQVGTGI